MSFGLHSTRPAVCGLAVTGELVRFGSQADICSAKRHVRFSSESGHVRCTGLCLLWAKSGHGRRYSITSSARASSETGICMPVALAVLRFITSSNFVCPIQFRSCELLRAASRCVAPRHAHSAFYRVIRPRLISTFDELIVYC